MSAPAERRPTMASALGLAVQKGVVIGGYQWTQPPTNPSSLVRSPMSRSRLCFAKHESSDPGTLLPSSNALQVHSGAGSGPSTPAVNVRIGSAKRGKADNSPAQSLSPNLRPASSLRASARSGPAPWSPGCGRCRLGTSTARRACRRPSRDRAGRDALRHLPPLRGRSDRAAIREGVYR